MTTTRSIPYASDLQRQQDDSHLNALVICHYVWGGIFAFLALMPIFHIAFGIAMITGAFDDNGQAFPTWFSWLVTAFAAFALIFGQTVAMLTLYSARQISLRRRRTLSLVVAGLNLLAMPLGTILGVFTLIVLLRDSVRLQYEAATAVATPAMTEGG